MTLLSPLPAIMIDASVRAALLEDLGRVGDVTGDATIPATLIGRAALIARQPGVVAGIDFARLAFHLMDSKITFTPKIKDGAAVKPGGVIATVKGSVRAILTAERTALNFLSHLSGIATATRTMVEAVKPHEAQICCTRKTTPGLRAAEKYAVRAGGGSNHRFGLGDAIVIKDNHIAALGGDLREAVLRARKGAGHMVQVELEVDSLAQLERALDLPLDAVLLDNMSLAELRRAVKMVRGRFITEASGRVTLENVREIAATGVDIISCGWITHSAPILDIGLDAV